MHMAWPSVHRKIQVMCQPGPHTWWPNPRITVKGNALEVVDMFTYLGNVLSKSVTLENEVNNRLAKTSATFGRLRKNVWDHEGLSAHTRHKVDKAVVLWTLLYACKTWTVYSRHVKKLNWFHLNCLCRLLHIHWWHRVHNTEVLNHPELSSIHTYLCKAQLYWAGHVLRMDDEHLPKCLLFDELNGGKGSIGGQRSTLRTLKASLKDLSIDPDVQESLVLDRASWQNTMHHDATSYEIQLTSHAIMKRTAHKARQCVLHQTVLSMSVHTVADSSMHILA